MFYGARVDELRFRGELKELLFIVGEPEGSFD